MNLGSVIHCIHIQTRLYEQSDSSTAAEKSARMFIVLRNHLSGIVQLDACQANSCVLLPTL